MRSHQGELEDPFLFFEINPTTLLEYTIVGKKIIIEQTLCKLL